MSPLSLAVIIATWNRPQRLAAALESVARQRRRPDQVIVSFTSADSSTREALPGIQAALRGAHAQLDLTVVEVEARNLLAKENAALQAAWTDIVCFLDDDAEAPPGWLRRIERYFQDGTVGGVGGPDLLPDAVPGLSRPVPIGRLDGLGRLHGNHHRPGGDGVLEVDFLKGCNMSFRRDLVSPLDTRLIGEIAYGFEIDLGLAARSAGARILYDPELTVAHHSVHDMSAARADLAFVTNHNQTYVVLKHLSWRRRLAFLAYTFLAGDRSTAGIARIAWMAVREGWRPVAWRAHLAGKWAGVASFVSWLSERPRSRVQDPAAEGTPAWQ